MFCFYNRGMKKLILFLLLAGCSFRPIFSGQNIDVYVAPISGVNGIELRNSLNAKFGGMREPSAEYSLMVNLQEPVTQYMALERTGDATWQKVTLNASYVLKYGDKEITSGFESASESYSFVRYLVAANASYNNAVLNSIHILADKIGMRVIAETQKNTD